MVINVEMKEHEGWIVPRISKLHLLKQQVDHHVKDLISSAIPGINGHNDSGYRDKTPDYPATEL